MLHPVITIAITASKAIPKMILFLFTQLHFTGNLTSITTIELKSRAMNRDTFYFTVSLNHTHLYIYF